MKLLDLDRQISCFFSRRLVHSGEFHEEFSLQMLMFQQGTKNVAISTSPAHQIEHCFPNIHLSCHPGLVNVDAGRVKGSCFLCSNFRNLKKNRYLKIRITTFKGTLGHTSDELQRNTCTDDFLSIEQYTQSRARNNPYLYLCQEDIYYCQVMIKKCLQILLNY